MSDRRISKSNYVWDREVGIGGPAPFNPQLWRPRHQREMLPDGPGYWRMTCTCGFVSVPYTTPHEALTAPCPVEVHLRESAWRREQMEETSRAANAAHR